MRSNISWKFIVIIALSVSSLSLVGTVGREPRNLALCKEEVESYVTSAKYTDDIRAVTTRAREYIEVHMKSSNRNAIVLDVDETALSHLKYELEMNFGYSAATWDEWLRKAQATPILPTLELYNWAKSKRIALFFLSGNREKVRLPLTLNLQMAGYASWDSLYMKPVTSRELTSSYKTKMRREITEKGFYIIANVGDQESDFVGGYAEKGFKLANPIYLVK